MGGATSKFEETDWDKADGKLRAPTLDDNGDNDDNNDGEAFCVTIDGAPPTTEFAVYYLNKRGLNQRDFDVTDEEDNLLYTTRQVPGTIACFDVSSSNLRCLGIGCCLFAHATV